ncbi:MAG: IS66 family transposase [Rhodovulum sp.]|nr:IS66 family transposase [Rhodovulum sp.]
MGLRGLKGLFGRLRGKQTRSAALPSRLDPDPLITVRKSEWNAKQRRIEELEATVAVLQATVTALQATNAALQARVTELEERLRTSSRNSSKPPSSDPPSVDRSRPSQGGGSGRKRGAQKGHPGKARSLLPPEQVDRVVERRPAQECDCGGRVVVDETPAERRQVCDIPEVKPFVIEFHLLGGVCERCGRRHRATLPEGTPEGMLGPRAMAAVGVLSGKYRLSKRNVEEILRDLFGLDLCLGTVSNAEATVSDALSEPVEEARSHVREQPVVHMDETSHKVAGRKAWLWVAATTLVSVFAIRFSRGADVAKEMLGELFRGRLVTDRWAGYNWFDVARRQLCWAHLLRDFTKIAERAGRAAAIGAALLEQARMMFELWHGLRDAALSRAAFRLAMLPIRERIESLLQEGVDCGHAKTSRTCSNLLTLRGALWTFVDVEGVEPTNNFGERTIRPGVLWRKTSFGTQSERGSRFVERMLTVTATCRQQGRNVLDYVSRAVAAKLRGDAAPSLLPAERPAPLALAA